MFSFNRILYYFLSAFASSIFFMICFKSFFYNLSNGIIFTNRDLAYITIFTTCIFFLFGISTIYFFKKQTTKDLLKIAGNLPSLNKKKINSFDDLLHQVNLLAETQSNEINTLQEREIYRRDFLGNISHELKTPLFSIQGYLLTLIEGGVNDLSIRDKYLKRINKSVDRMIFLVNDLDLISDLEKGRINLKTGIFNLTSLTQDVIDLLEIKAEKNKVKIEFNHPFDQPIKVVGDIEKIQQVLVNLIVNAINYSDEGKIIKINFKENNDSITISILDQGIGIRKQDIDRIFERFYRVDKSRNRTQGGSGLGLAIVKHILDAHDQQIYVKSKINEGSIFSFNLKKFI